MALGKICCEDQTWVSLP